jgi:hypothetical protein
MRKKQNLIIRSKKREEFVCFFVCFFLSTTFQVAMNESVKLEGLFFGCDDR